MTIRKLREPGSAVTHLVALILTLAAAGPLIHVAGFTPDRKAALTVFVWSMATLYLASTLFHAICASPRSSLHLQRFDHASIYLLIAGSYTPICVISLTNRMATNFWQSSGQSAWSAFSRLCLSAISQSGSPR